MTDAEIRKKLDEIAAQMKKPGANIEELSKKIDKLLGTALPEEDPEIVGAWERRNRSRR